MGYRQEKIKPYEQQGEKAAQVEQITADAKTAADEAAAKLDEATEQIKTLNETIKGSEGDAQKLKDLQEKVHGYEKAEADRKKAEEEATKEAGIRARFDGLKGENKYLNEGTETWILNEFKKALDSKDNAGKSDYVFICFHINYRAFFN